MSSLVLFTFWISGSSLLDLRFFLSRDGSSELSSLLERVASRRASPIFGLGPGGTELAPESLIAIELNFKLNFLGLFCMVSMPKPLFRLLLSFLLGWRRRLVTRRWWLRVFVCWSWFMLLPVRRLREPYFFIYFYRSLNKVA